MRGIIDHQIESAIKLCFNNRSEPGFVCLVRLPVRLDLPVQLPRLDIAAEIGGVGLILDVECDMFLWPEQFIPERGAASVKYAQFYHSLGEEIGTAGAEVCVLIDQFFDLVETEMVASIPVCGPIVASSTRKRWRLSSNVAVALCTVVQACQSGLFASPANRSKFRVGAGGPVNKNDVEPMDCCPCAVAVRLKV